MVQTERRQTIVVQGRDFNDWDGPQPASHFLIEAGRRPTKHYAMSIMKALHDNLYDTFTLKAKSKANIKVCYSVCTMVNHWITVKEIRVERATLWCPEKLLIIFKRGPRFRDNYVKALEEARLGAKIRL